MRDAGICAKRVFVPELRVSCSVCARLIGMDEYFYALNNRGEVFCDDCLNECDGNLHGRPMRAQ